MKRSSPGRLVAVSVCLWGAAITTACGAPRAEKAGGEIARAVEASLAGGRERFAHAAWDALLRAGTRDGLVDYVVMKERRSDLEAYLEALAQARLSALAPGHLEALLINAYNAHTVLAVLDHPGIASIRDIPGVWTERRQVVGGFAMTLDDIEHRILRPYFRDPRVHFALNCASRSCAPLPPWAYDGERIDAQLEERARSFLSDVRNARIERGRLLLSRYFDWYGGDFTAKGWKGAAASLPAYVERYASAEVKAAIDAARGRPPIEFLDYDWSLNAARP